MKDKIFLEQDAQEIFNIIDALQFYRDNAIQPKYKSTIDKQLTNLIAQVNLQGVNIYKNDKEPKMNFGETVVYEGKKAIIVRMSDDAGFVQIAVAEGDDFRVIDVPAVLIGKEVI